MGPHAPHSLRHRGAGRARPTLQSPAHAPRHHAGEMRHLGVGRAHSRAPVLLLIHDRDVTVSRLDTGDVIGEFTIDPAKDYQARNPATPA